MNFNLKINPELKMKSDIMFKAFFARKENEEFINVEIQLRDNHNIEKRTTFYASKKITEQLGGGEDYRELKTIIIIAILDYSFIELPEYVTETVRVAKDDKEYEINNDVKYYYIELEKFRKQNPDMTKRINHWLSFLDMERGKRTRNKRETNRNC